MDSDPSLQRAKLFVENFFGSLGSTPIEPAYLNYLRDIELYSQTNPGIRDNSTYLCYLFGKVTNTPVEELLRIEGKYKRPPLIIPFNPQHLADVLSENGLENVIYKYTAEDAVNDGIFVKIGQYSKVPVYITSHLFADGYNDTEKLKALVDKGIQVLLEKDNEDTDHLRLRVIEKNKIWVCLTGEGITFMKPEDY